MSQVSCEASPALRLSTQLQFSSPKASTVLSPPFFMALVSLGADCLSSALLLQIDSYNAFVPWLGTPLPRGCTEPPNLGYICKPPLKHLNYAGMHLIIQLLVYMGPHLHLKVPLVPLIHGEGQE